MERTAWFCIMLIMLLPPDRSSAQSNARYGGVRASRILGNYPNRQFPSPAYWIGASKWMAGKYSDAMPAAVWIVSLAGNNGESLVGFPSGGRSYPDIVFSGTDYSDAHLSAFDTSGVRVWLQVEPGSANVDTLIDLVLSRYSHHPCVAGFGIDVEWLAWKTNSGGRKLTDSLELKRWEERVRTYDPSYTLFVKHYSAAWMPSMYRGKLLFIDDSQGHASYASMVNEFKNWGAKFYPAPVGFQFGYKADSTWWKPLGDPPAQIGNELFANIPNATAMFWVDFTLTSLYTVTRIAAFPFESLPVMIRMMPSYPNPFNPSTTIRFSLPVGAEADVKIFDQLGREIAVLVDGYCEAGTYDVRWMADDVPSGVYYCRFRSENVVRTQRLVLVK